MNIKPIVPNGALWSFIQSYPTICFALQNLLMISPDNPSVNGGDSVNIYAGLNFFTLKHNKRTTMLKESILMTLGKDFFEFDA